MQLRLSEGTLRESKLAGSAPPVVAAPGALSFGFKSLIMSTGQSKGTGEIF